MNQRIIVIGGLAAGPSAASKAKRVNPEADVILFEAGEHVSYGICEMPYYISGAIKELSDIVPLDASGLQNTRGITVRTGHRVEQIMTTKRKVLVRDLERDKLSEHAFDRLIIATGSRPRRIGIEPQACANLFHVKELTDTIALKKYLEERKPQRCVLVGAGYVGMEMCEALRCLGIGVSLLQLEEYPLAELEPETSKQIVSTLRNHGVDFHPAQNVRSYETDDRGFIRSVTTSGGSFRCDVVVQAVGVEPNTDLAREARIECGRFQGIVTDERQRTSVDSVFAAGDCCEVKNLVTGKHSYIPLATYASRQGRVAGENAAGGRAIFKGGIRAIAVKIFDLEVAHVGLSSKEAVNAGFDPVKVEVSSGTKVSSMPGNEQVHITAIADKATHRLLGADVFGGQGAVLRANVLGIAVQHKLTAEELSQIDLVYSPPFSRLWDPVLVVASELKKRIPASH